MLFCVTNLKCKNFIINSKPLERVGKDFLDLLFLWRKKFSNFDFTNTP